MKRFLYFMICIVIISVGGLFVLKSPSGEPWLSTSDFYDAQGVSRSFDDFKRSIFKKFEKITNPAPANEESKIYKWQDESGVYHYTDHNDARGDAWEKPDNLTIMPESKPVDVPKVNAIAKKSNIETVNSSGINMTNAAELMSDAKNVQKLIDDRKKSIDDQLK